MLLLLSCDCTAKMVIFISKKYSNVDFTRMRYHRNVDFTWQSANNEFREQVTWTFCYLSSEINISAVLSSREINIFPCFKWNQHLYSRVLTQQQILRYLNTEYLENFKQISGKNTGPWFSITLKTTWKN